MNDKHILIILDGYGIAEDPSVSAIDHARKPYLDMLFERYPHSQLLASGRNVGLPEGQMGNSEVGHMNLGAGRIVYQDITRIDLQIENGEFFGNDVLQASFASIQGSGRPLHVMGLFSDGGVHSHLNHLYALLEMGKRNGLVGDQIVVHAFTDGRDTDPHAGKEYFKHFERRSADAGVGRLASVIGRYWAMDRDHRWPRTEKAYRLLMAGMGTRYESAAEALEANYAAGVTDEFVEPCTIGSDLEVAFSRIRSGDSVLIFNFRADRVRQLTASLIQPEFDKFVVSSEMDLLVATFTSYESDFDVPVAFPKVNLEKTLGEIIADRGERQLRAAETEKYPHVTYFFSGGREDPFPGEERILVPSPKIATYDLQPEMSASELADKVASALKEMLYRFVVLNFANPDMVGHTGDFNAAVRAVETVDTATKVVVEAARTYGYSVSIIADHGNADRMRNPDGTPHTAHTTVPVPHLIISDGFTGPIRRGKLGDVAPTILRLLDIPIPEEMTGEPLIDR